MKKLFKRFLPVYLCSFFIEAALFFVAIVIARFAGPIPGGDEAGTILLAMINSLFHVVILYIAIKKERLTYFLPDAAAITTICGVFWYLDANRSIGILDFRLEWAIMENLLFVLAFYSITFFLIEGILWWKRFWKHKTQE